MPGRLPILDCRTATPLIPSSTSSSQSRLGAPCVAALFVEKAGGGVGGTRATKGLADRWEHASRQVRVGSRTRASGCGLHQGVTRSLMTRRI